ncbi:hypothetical protein [Methanimicrococcus hacksteinii]|uniref:hypothetical protein n=1 Tax=Methanimicrococcus hacksteinii TaxID=3028293 RepID=UPI00298F08EC|nr:hypothetical protein [Methanimicrococcus sp. At1]
MGVDCHLLKLWFLRLKRLVAKGESFENLEIFKICGFEKQSKPKKIEKQMKQVNK